MGWVALGLAVIGCGPEPPPPYGIVARAETSGRAGSEAVTTRPFRIGAGTRSVVEARGFELAVPDTADRLEWSAALFASEYRPSYQYVQE